MKAASCPLATQVRRMVLAFARIELCEYFEEILRDILVHLELFIDTVVPYLLDFFSSVFKEVELKLPHGVPEELVFFLQVFVFLRELIEFDSRHEAEDNIKIDHPLIHLDRVRYRILLLSGRTPELPSRLYAFLLHF